MRRCLKVFVLFTIVGGIFTMPSAFAATNAVVFKDVPQNHPYAFAIASLKELGYIKGYNDNTFRPDQTITRAEALAILVNIINASRQTHAMVYPEAPDSSFTDVPAESWYKTYVNQGVALKLISGYGDKTFQPLQPIKLQEALKMSLQMFGVTSSLAAKSQEGTSWFKPYFDFAKENRLVDPATNGASGFFYSPYEPLTRGEMAELLFRIKFLKENGKPFDYTVEWKTFSHDANFFEVKYPASWEIFKGAKNSVVWRTDPKNGQTWFTRITPFGARLSISFVEKQTDPELASAKVWFSKIRERQQALYSPPASKKDPSLEGTEKFVEFQELVRSGKSILLVNIPKKHFLDAYIFLGPGKTLVFYSEYGHSPQSNVFSDFLKEQLREIIRSYRYVEPKPPAPPPLTPEQILEKIHEAILIEGKGPEIFKLLDDEKLIETDAIGVGTGPVDYFYSQTLNVTIKYERSSKTILNVREGRTTTF